MHGLRGRHHPALANVITASEVKKLRPHLKLLSGYYLTFNAKYEQTNKGSPLCPLCSLENETVCHMIAVYSAYNAIRTRVMNEVGQLLLLCKNTRLNLTTITENSEIYTQFILDPTSFNLKHRIHVNDPIVEPMFGLCRDLSYGIHTERIRQMKNIM